MDTGSLVDWRPITAVLGRIGDAGFDGLLQGLVSAPTEESRERVGFAFSRLGVAVLDRYTVVLTHPVPLVRRQAVRGIEHCGEAGRSAAVLPPLLGDPDQEVARQAQDTLIRTPSRALTGSIAATSRASSSSGSGGTDQVGLLAVVRVDRPGREAGLGDDVGDLGAPKFLARVGESRHHTPLTKRIPVLLVGRRGDTNRMSVSLQAIL
ncbi:hypothetical protein OG588_26600 [Streptomyces prunicolor]|uniref:hypothetical protein n=1 Tax=Streptomyces prunicolor TaxID=67348 RepID=UPI00386821A4|nr:hypothetical protein OG588_26600 [Streptomyces prunicolor]